METSLKLNKIVYKEFLGPTAELEIPEVTFQKFNLIIGDNGQGKTRLYNLFHFFKSLVTEKQLRRIGTTVDATIEFKEENNSKTDLIEYHIEVSPSTEGNLYSETISHNKKIIFSSKEKILFNEKSGENIPNFFVPKNIPALTAIDEPGFETISKIRSFFSRMVFVSAKKSNFLHVSQNAEIVNQEGTDLSSVLKNWQKKYPEIFREVTDEFKRCFPIVKDVSFSELEAEGGIKGPILQFKEKDVIRQINQLNWSDGMHRLLWLLCSVKTPFHRNGQKLSPSLVFIDEVEDGLDYKTLRYIVEYLIDSSNDIQIFASTHTPIIINFVHPKHWRIVKRSGTKVSIMPINEQNLNDELKNYKNINWDFYTKHISNSNLYVVK